MAGPAGAGRTICDETRGQVPAGTVFWLFPGRRHSYGPHDSGWSERWVLFTGPAALAYERAGLLQRTRPVAPVRNLDETRRLLTRMRTALDHPAVGTEVTVAGLLHQLVAGLPGSARSAPPGLLDVLRSRARDARSVEEHAAVLGLSVPDLRAHVRAATGRSVKGFLVASRLNLAQRLLAESDLTVAAIGRRVGYDDPAYFTRIFGRHIGMSPAAFRRRYLRVAPIS
jgi:AraC-like DNA-binding protein